MDVSWVELTRQKRKGKERTDRAQRRVGLSHQCRWIMGLSVFETTGAAVKRWSRGGKVNDRPCRSGGETKNEQERGLTEYLGT
jgi:hypothetical protein